MQRKHYMNDTYQTESLNNIIPRIYCYRPTGVKRFVLRLKLE